MTPGEFIGKWRASELKERSGAQEHFIDLCRLLGEPTPAEADPTGEHYCFERGARKDTGGDGWADVWKRHCFAWEYKGRRADLDAAFNQLRQYALALENPPLLIVSDMSRFRVRTNWTNSVSLTHEFTLDDVGEAIERFRTASEAGNSEAMNGAMRAVLKAVDARREAVASNDWTAARVVVMEAIGTAAGASDDAARDAALANLDPKARATFLEAAPEPWPAMTAGELMSETDDALDWLVDRLLPAGGTSLLLGTPKSGKSTMARILAAKAAAGVQWYGRNVKAGPVLYVARDGARRCASMFGPWRRALPDPRAPRCENGCMSRSARARTIRRLRCGGALRYRPGARAGGGGYAHESVSVRGCERLRVDRREHGGGHCPGARLRGARHGDPPFPEKLG